MREDLKGYPEFSKAQVILGAVSYTHLHGKDASQRAELKERIIATATEAFTTKGIKSITMDDIAAALGLSLIHI